MMTESLNTKNENDNQVAENLDMELEDLGNVNKLI